MGSSSAVLSLLFESRSAEPAPGLFSWCQGDPVLQSSQRIKTASSMSPSAVPEGQDTFVVSSFTGRVHF